MKIRTLIEVVTAAHLAKHVEGEFRQFGGIMLVAPPGNLKTTVVESLETFSGAHVCSDVNVTSLMNLRPMIVRKMITTLAFTEFEKIYQRQDSTAKNVEATLKAMIEEGFSQASFEDQILRKGKARCLLIAAITDDLYEQKFAKWRREGFARRFLWSHFQLEDPNVVLEAIHRWKRLDLNTDSRTLSLPKYGYKIPYQLSDSESRELERMLPQTDEHSTPLVLLKKIACVLHWRYPRMAGNAPDFAWMILRDFAESIKGKGEPAQLVLDDWAEKPEQSGIQISEADLVRDEGDELTVPEVVLSGSSSFISTLRKKQSMKKQAKILNERKVN